MTAVLPWLTAVALLAALGAAVTAGVVAAAVRGCCPHPEAGA